MTETVAPIRACKITRNVVVLSWVSFFTDLASEMLYPVIPIFLVGSLGVSTTLLGLIEGLAEGISSGLRWLIGTLSDRTGQRKPFIVAGYTLSAISKPLMGASAFAFGWPLFLLSRCSDRLGKSLRTGARDALIADSTDPAYCGLAFGFHRAADTCGAVIGPLASLVVLKWKPDLPLAWLFFIALGPGVLSSFLVGFAIRDVPRAPSPEVGMPPLVLQKYPIAFWHLIGAFAVFSLGNSSDSFLILRSKEIGLSFPQVILVYTLYNAVYALSSIPLGHLSDRIGRKPVLASGWLVYALVYGGFAWFRTPTSAWVLFSLYGLYQGFAEGAAKAMVSDLVPKHQRAGAMGLFSMVGGICQLGASVLAGFLWNVRLFDHRVMATFLIGAIVAFLALPLVSTVPTKRREEVTSC